MRHPKHTQQTRGVKCLVFLCGLSKDPDRLSSTITYLSINSVQYAKVDEEALELIRVAWRAYAVFVAGLTL